MTIYLTIITTVLVLTQIIRLMQNHKQLKRLGKVDNNNELIKKVYEKIDAYLSEEGVK